MFPSLFDVENFCPWRGGEITVGSKTNLLHDIWVNTEDSEIATGLQNL